MLVNHHGLFVKSLVWGKCDIPAIEEVYFGQKSWSFSSINYLWWKKLSVQVNKAVNCPLSLQPAISTRLVPGSVGNRHIFQASVIPVNN